MNTTKYMEPTYGMKATIIPAMITSIEEMSNLTPFFPDLSSPWASLFNPWRKIAIPNKARILVTQSAPILLSDCKRAPEIMKLTDFMVSFFSIAVS